jgi:AAA domain
MAIDTTPYIQEGPRPNGDAPPHGRRRLGLICFDQIKPGSEPSYLMKGIVPREGITVEWGEPKCGKSFQASDMAFAVARGIDYRGRRVQQGPVVYCAAEGATGFRNRVEAYRQHHGIEGELPFYLVPDALDLIADAEALVASIRETLGDVKPVLVVLDTPNRSLNGDENAPTDMGAYVKAADLVRGTFHCAVLIVHHCGVEAKRPRGHTSLTGAADAQLAVKRTADGTICTTVEWMKDGPEGDTLYSNLRVVTVGIDQDGDEITSCVVVEADAPATPMPTHKLGKNEQTMFDILADHMPNG